ncbi:MAG: hypothetical protein LN408_03350 [Candidatus Thermoplasmatota archaeon]|nr:hypothetical protein [Candidatus Thermoplasmatota archaeon]
MSFIRKKTIKGNDYFYEVESIREGDKVRQKVIKYLGTTKPTEKIIEKAIEKKEDSDTAIKLKELDSEIDENIIVLKKEKIDKEILFIDLISGETKVKVTEKITFKTKFTKKEFVMYWAPDHMLGKVIDSRGLDIIKEF